MSIQKNLQIRVEVEGELKEFTYNNKTYQIIGVSSSWHLIPDTPTAGVFFNGNHNQYTAVEQGTNNLVEIYVYYYVAYFGGTRYAVIDTIDDKGV